MKLFTKPVQRMRMTRSSTAPSARLARSMTTARCNLPVHRAMTSSSHGRPAPQAAMMMRPAIRAFSQSKKMSFSRPSNRILTPAKQTLMQPRVHSATALHNKKFSAAAQQHEILQGFPEYLTQIPETRVSELSNNFKIATQPTNSQIATIAVTVDAGSAYEDDQNNGVAHFLEHMAFKGTQSRSRTQLEVEIENMGGSLNAYTSREQTVYIARVLKDDVGKAANILSDILQRSTYDESAIELERSTILREMDEVNKVHGELVFDMLHASAFQGHPLGRTILGPPENIKRIKRQDLVNYVDKFYRPNRMVLSGAGAVDHQQLCDIAQKEFGGMAKPQLDADYNAIRAPQFMGSQVLMTDDSLETLNMALAVEGVGWWNADYFVFRVIQTLMGSWDHTVGGGKNLSSNICETIATEKIAKSFTGFTTCYRSTGLLGAYFEAEPTRADDCIWLVFNEWNRLANNVRPEEVERAKSKLKASVLMGLDSTNAISEDIGRQILQFGRRISPAEAFVRIDAVRPKDVARVASQYCHDAVPVVSALGPTKHLPDYNHILEWTSWRRV